MWGVCDRCILGDRRRCMWLIAYIASFERFPALGSSLFLSLDFIVGFSVVCVYDQIFLTNEPTLHVL